MKKLKYNFFLFPLILLICGNIYGWTTKGFDLNDNIVEVNRPIPLHIWSFNESGNGVYTEFNFTLSDDSLGFIDPNPSRVIYHNYLTHFHAKNKTGMVTISDGSHQKDIYIVNSAPFEIENREGWAVEETGQLYAKGLSFVTIRLWSVENMISKLPTGKTFKFSLSGADNPGHLNGVQGDGSIDVFGYALVTFVTEDPGTIRISEEGGDFVDLTVTPVAISPTVFERIRRNPEHIHYLSEDIDLDEVKANHPYDPGDSYNDFDENGNFIPIENFSGTLDGQGYKIKNLYHHSSGDNLGLFRDIQGGTIRNVHLTEVDLLGNNYVGGLAATVESGSQILNCSVQGNIIGNDYVGGIAAFVEGEGHIDFLNPIPSIQIEKCKSNINIQGHDWVGGILGDVSKNVNINNCSTLGRVEGNSCVGGIAGHSNVHSHLNDCFASLEVFGNESVGGLVGEAEYTSLIQSAFEGIVTGENECVGGVVGKAFASEINRSYGNSEVIGPKCVGGLVGLLNDSSIYCSYAKGTIHNKATLPFEAAGGLVGQTLHSGQPEHAINVHFCYSAVTINKTGSNSSNSIGGFVGNNDLMSIYQSNYWDLNILNFIVSNPDTGGNVGLPTVEMYEFFTYWDWPMNYIWFINEGIDYPYLLIEKSLSATIDEDGFTVFDFGQMVDESDILSLPQHGALSFDGLGKVTYTPYDNYHGRDQFSIRESASNLVVTKASIIINPINDPPTIQPQYEETLENTTKEIILKGEDVDDVSLSYIINDPGNGTALIAGDTVTYTPNQDFTGLDSFTFQAFDGEAYSESALVHITVSSEGIPQNFTKSRVDNKQLKIQRPNGDSAYYPEETYTIKGVTWEAAKKAPTSGTNPADLGASIPYGFFNNREGQYETQKINGIDVFTYWNKKEVLEHYEQDIPYLKQMNVNTVLLHFDLLNEYDEQDPGYDPNNDPYMDVLDEFYKHGILVLMTVVREKKDLLEDYYLYPDKNAPDPANYFIKVWTGTACDTEYDDSGNTCIRITGDPDFFNYKGVEWLYPEGYTSSSPTENGRDITGYSYLKFRAKSSTQKNVAVRLGNPALGDSGNVAWSQLVSSGWEDYKFTLSDFAEDLDLDNIHYGLNFNLSSFQYFYADDIRFSTRPINGPVGDSLEGPRFQEVVEKFKNHPVVLGWVVGYEWNVRKKAWNTANGEEGDYGGYSSLESAKVAFNKAAGQVKSFDPNHVVFSILKDDFNGGVSPSIPSCIPSESESNIDGWGLNVNRSRDHFQQLFTNDWDPNLPVFISQFGIDSCHTGERNEVDGVIIPSIVTVEEDLQLEYFRDIWNIIVPQLSKMNGDKNCLGGCVYTFSDEWYKVGSRYKEMYVVSQSGSEHGELDDEGFPRETDVFPDGVANIEHFGLMGLNGDGSLRPKSIVNGVRSAFDDNPPSIPVSNVAELQAIQIDPAGSYYLLNDIDCSGFSFQAISNFTGLLDGRGKVIDNLSVNESGRAGLFASVIGGTVQNLGLVNVDIHGENEVGGLAGKVSSQSIISACFVEGSVEGESCVGGLVGKNAYSTISNSYSQCDVLENTSSGGSIGGLVGKTLSSSLTKARVENCYSAGNVTGNSLVGGFIGSEEGSSSSEFSLNYWNFEIAGLTENEDSGSGDMTGIQGKNTDSMYLGSTFSGWDFTSLWFILEEQNYPRLRKNISEAPHPDVSVMAISSGEPRPGFEIDYTFYCFNRGSEIAENVILSNWFSSDVTFISSSQLPSEVHGQKYVWNMGDLDPKELGKITVTVRITTTIPLGDIMTNQSLVSTDSIEVMEANNSFYHDLLIQGSWDPNEKVVSPQGFIRGDERLNYVIHYENEGTLPAIYVTIEDKLPSLLDVSTLKDISHGGVYIPERRTIRWYFEHINLEPGETDHVSYSIKPIENLLPLTEIRNKALITFDYNAPMETPETVNIIGVEESLEVQAEVQHIIQESNDILNTLKGIQGLDITPFSEKLNLAVIAAGEVLHEMVESSGEEGYWKALNLCHVSLNEVKEMIQEQSGTAIPEEIAGSLTNQLEDEMIGALKGNYPIEPIAKAGPDISIEAMGSSSQVTLDGSASFSPNPEFPIESFRWYDRGGTLVAQGESPTLQLGPGYYSFTLVGNNGQSDSIQTNYYSEEDSRVEVSIQDTTAPAFEITGMAGHISDEGENTFFNDHPVVISYEALDLVDHELSVFSSIGVVDQAQQTITIEGDLPLGVVEVLISVTDDWNNRTEKRVHFTLVPSTIEAHVVIKPEVLHPFSRHIMALVKLPAPYDPSRISHATCEGAPLRWKVPFKRMNFCLLFFRRKDMTEKPLDRHFTLQGICQHEGDEVFFRGEDSIRKVMRPWRWFPWKKFRVRRRDC